MVIEQFTLNRPVVTKDPLVQVDPKTITVGKHVFQLAVQDNQGNSSAIAQQTVVVLARPPVGFPPPIGVTPPVIGGPGQPTPVVPPGPVLPPGPVIPVTPGGVHLTPKTAKPQTRVADSASAVLPEDQPPTKPRGTRARKKRPGSSKNK